MASKTNCSKNGKDYYRMTRTIGYKANKAGNKVPVRKEFYGKNKAEAERKFKAYMERKNKGLEGKTQYFGIMAENWIFEFLLNDHRLKDSTKELYFCTWKKYVAESDLYYLPLDEITAGTLQRFYNNIDCPASSLAAINKTMSRFYKYLVTEGFATHNLTASLSVRKEQRQEPKEIRIWTDEELYHILHSFDRAQEGFRFRFLLVLAANTGCRISELLGLKYSDIVDGELRVQRQTARIPTFTRNGQMTYEVGTTTLKSNNSYRIIPLSAPVLRELDIHRAWQRKDMLKNGYRTDFIFTTSTGAIYDRHNVNHACARYYKRIGIECKGMHTYRHTFGTRLCQKGVSIQKAAVLLGHSDINITAKYYVNVSAEEKRAAISLLSDIM